MIARSIFLFLALTGSLRAEPIEAIPGPGEPLSIEAAVAAAVRVNGTLEAARRARGELEGQMWQATSTAMPVLDLTGSWIRSRDPSFALDSSFGTSEGESSPLDSLFGDFSFIPAPEDIPSQSFWRTSLDATWTLNPSRILNAVGAARAGVERQDEIIRGTENAIIEATMLAYYEVIAAAEGLEAIEAALAAQRESLKISRQRLALDLATPLDTLRASISVANLLPDERRRHQAVRDAGARLNTLMGRDAATALALSEAPRVEEDMVDEEEAIFLAQRRPGLRQMELAVDVMRRGEGAEKAARYPALTFFGSYGYVGKDPGTLFDTGHDSWNVGVSVALPLFDGFLARGRIAEAQARVEKNVVLTEEVARDARREVIALLGNLGVARTNLRTAELALHGAEQVLETTLRQYRNDRSTYLDVLDAQSQRLASHWNLIGARHEVLAHTASLKRALGLSPLTPLSTISKRSLQLRREAS